MEIEGFLKIKFRDGKHIRQEGICKIRDIFDKEDVISVDIEGKANFINLKSKTINLCGEFKGNEIIGENIFIDGKVKMSLITTDKLEIILSENKDSKIDSVICNNLLVKIRKEEQKPIMNTYFKKLFSGFNKYQENKKTTLWIDNIKADKVEISNCCIDKIEAKSVIVNDNCKINKLFYGELIVKGKNIIIKEKFNLKEGEEK